jgi:glutamate dehydrogenase
MTQRGRIAAARAGVRLNTDAIDNSAGVNTSDVEVNLKIALGRPLRDGRLDRAARDLLLAAMTDEVAALVLRNNSQQTLAISLAERRGFDDLGFQQRLMQTLEQRGLLDRALEFLPDDATIAERRLEGTPLTRPELAVLLAYAKLSLAADLLESAMPDDPYLGRELARYFPAVMVQRFPDALEAHRLRREIISTRLANSIVNRGGPTVVVRIADRTGASVDRIAAAFAAVRDAFDLLDLDTRIEALDDRVPGEVQLALLEQVQNLLLDRMVWMLRHVDPSGGLAAVVAHYRAGIVTIRESFGRILSENARQLVDARAADLARAGVPHDLAGRVAELPWLASATDAVLVAERTGADVVAVARTWFAAAAYFRLDGLVASARAIPVTDHFDRLALDRALDGLSDAGRRIVAEMMRASDGLSGARAVDAWVAPRRAAVERVRLALQEIAGAGLTVSRATVAASVLGDLAPQG